MPPVVAESRSTATRAMRGANSFKSSNDFARRPNSWTENPVTLPPGRARLAIKPPPTGSVAAANTIGMARVTSSRARTLVVTAPRMTSGASATSSAAYRRKKFRLASGPANVEADVAADGPAQFLQSLHEGHEAGLSFRILRSERHQHSDTPQPAALLCARRERPRRRAAEQRDELAAFHHSITSSAATSSLSGTVRPSILAVEALMTSSNLVGCRTGSSAG